MTELETIEKLRQQATSELDQVSSSEALEEWRVTYIGRKGKVPMLLRTVRDIPEEDRKTFGQAANALRIQLEKQYKSAQARISDKGEQSTSTVPKGMVDIVSNEAQGHLHPLTLTIQRIQHIFAAMGFINVEGPEVEEEYYNFDQLNVPFEHPARAESDTFYVTSQEANTRYVLRTQTSPMQLRAVLQNNLTPPFRVLSPGRVFRSEKVDATHESTFYQFEGLVVGDGASIADFKGIMETFFSSFFEVDITTRLRPSYFPFVEPGFEVDISCPFCKSGCRVCKHTTWVEVLGAGMVHPNVLQNMNVDGEKYQGFAFGGAVDRLTMLRHGINDIRLLWSGDIRFLKQFS